MNRDLDIQALPLNPDTGLYRATLGVIEAVKTVDSATARERFLRTNLPTVPSGEYAYALAIVPGESQDAIGYLNLAVQDMKINARRRIDREEIVKKLRETVASAGSIIREGRLYFDDNLGTVGEMESHELSGLSAEALKAELHANAANLTVLLRAPQISRTP